MPLSETLMSQASYSLAANLAHCDLQTSLADWLAALETYQMIPSMRKLAEVKAIAKRLAINTSQRLIITVAGTNGKGSTVAMLEACLLAQGYRVAAYTSPHLMHYRERFRVQGRMLSDANIVEAMYAVKSALQNEVIHYFDFTTLVGFWLFMQQPLDIWLLEVGLGGRLDAVNIVDANICVISSIALDHIAELGSDREAIGCEKAGIMRENRPVVIGDPDPPKSLFQHAIQLNCPIFCAAIHKNQLVGAALAAAQQYSGGHKGRPYIGYSAHLNPSIWGDEGYISTFSFDLYKDSWDCQGQGWAYHDLPKPNLPIANAALVLQVLQCIKDDFPVDEIVMRQSLAKVQLVGRMQCIHESPEIWVDVAHNPAASLYLATQLQTLPAKPTIAVVGMMADKDITATLLPWVNMVDTWYVVPLASPRAAKVDDLALRLQELQVKSVYIGESLALVLQRLTATAPEQRVIVFGSFVLVGEALALYRPL